MLLPEISHKRRNILTDEWVLVSPHRAKRPWQGQKETPATPEATYYDPSCYLCAGNKRANGTKNPLYKGTYVFTNDFAALNMDCETEGVREGLFQTQVEKGICRVVCFSEDHSKTLATMQVAEISAVVALWQTEYETLGAHSDINYIQIFENKGAVMGCSNPHPHGQIWAQSSLPNEVVKKEKTQKDYYGARKESLLQAYLESEMTLQERILYENDFCVVLIPFWAVWPYETMIVPKKQQEAITEMSEEDRWHFAEAIQVITKAYDRLFNCSFPYSSGIHQAPTNGETHDYWHWHMSFYPPLLRSATVKKFMVGYEMFGMPQRDITAEMAAEKLRSCIKVEKESCSK